VNSIKYSGTGFDGYNYVAGRWSWSRFKLTSYFRVLDYEKGAYRRLPNDAIRQGLRRGFNHHGIAYRHGSLNGDLLELRGQGRTIRLRGSPTPGAVED